MLVNSFTIVAEGPVTAAAGVVGMVGVVGVVGIVGLVDVAVEDAAITVLDAHPVTSEVLTTPTTASITIERVD
jgi:hypothetical protein